jgi:DNA-binding CsgD family transcriptional regulator
MSTMLAAPLPRTRPERYRTELPVPACPGMLLVTDTLEPSGWTPGSREWIRSVQGDGDVDDAGLVRALVDCLSAAEEREAEPRFVGLGVRAADGWAIAQAARLRGAGVIAIHVGRATRDQALELFASRHRLTPREREIVHLLADGLDTRALADRLFISKYTVQDHLKAIFEKCGVRTRLGLIASATGTGAGPQAMAAP